MPANEQDRAPWGPWTTGGLTLIVVGAFLATQMLVAMVLLVIGEWTAHPALGTPHDLAGSGIYWAVATLVSAPVEVALILVFALLRRGYPVYDYLALHRLGVRPIGRWLLVLLAFAIACDGVTWFVGRPIVPDVMIHACQTAVVPPLLWLALIVAAPVSEEFLFRGFLFRGLEGTALGPVGTVTLTSLLWSTVHLQYDLYAIGIIFLAGLLFGYARWVTGSLMPSLLMHALMNLLATVQAMIASRAALP
jgi:membrane protease YdiL (CAAX protease family)